jgi:hypothetical protein
MISAVQSRVFLLHNVHEKEPVVFHTRWAMSFLRGPLTRPQVQQLVGAAAPPAASHAVPGAPVPEPVATRPAPPQPEPAVPDLPYSQIPPQLPSSVKQVFLPTRVSLRAALSDLARDRQWAARSGREEEGILVYQPVLAGAAKLRFAHTKSRQTHSQDVAYLLTLEGEVTDWSQAQVELETRGLESSPDSGAYFAELPSELGDSKRYTALKKEFNDYLYYNSSVALWYNPHLKLYSEFGETPEAFQRRCRVAAKEGLDAEAEKVKDKYERMLDRLEDKLQREERELEEDKIEHSARKQEELLSGVESVFGLFSGRRSSRRLSTASRKRRMTRQAKADIEESEEVIEELEKEIEELEQEAKEEIEELTEKWLRLIDEVEEVEVRPRRADVQINLFALGWLPHWEVRAGDQVYSIPAFEVEYSQA